ncbi:MAG: hypothetical protein J5850_02965 [Clostridia bacterium]|nr:hypothetical protein [Clostridia bacterium]
MKIKTKNLPLDEVLDLKKPPYKKPVKPSKILTSLAALIGKKDLKETNFKCDIDLGDALDKPSLILMNHSSFIDLEICETIFKNKPFNIVCTSDGFVGKYALMRRLGCIPTRKFVTDLSLIRDIKYCLKTLGTSVLMYPEASYTFDGTATPLPERIGVLIKALGVPVIMVKTRGAFLRDPLYNMLQKRAVNVSASARCIVSYDEIKSLSAEQITSRIESEFVFDGFAEQLEDGVLITEPFRADGLHRILYKCPSCLCEEKTEGKGTRLICRNCGKEWELNENGSLSAIGSETRFSHIPDWYKWEREEVRSDIESGNYKMACDVDVGIMVDYNSIYFVGSGKLSHGMDGFVLDGCDGKLHYEQSPLACYSLYSDYFWYELGDVICIGDCDYLYYCFPKNRNIVAKTRLAAEELYKYKKRETRKQNG